MFRKGDLVRCIADDTGLHTRNPPIGSVGVIIEGSDNSTSSVFVAWFDDRPNYYCRLMADEVAHVEIQEG